jgi:hypothetical protein
MKTHWFFLLFGLMPICLCNSLCRAEEPVLTLDSVLEKWETASQECKILDAKLEFFRYDRVFSAEKPEMEYGRIYYESPTVSKIEIGKKPIDAAKDWSADEGTIIWNGAEGLRIDPKERTYVKMPLKNIQDAWDQPLDGFFAKMAHAFILAALPPPRPQTLWPLMVDVRAEEIKKDFEVSFERSGDDVLIAAVPKKDTQPRIFHAKIRVLLDSKTFRTKAVQYINDSWNYSSVVLYEQKYNEKPSDRDPLAVPDLSGFRTVEDKMLFGPQRHEEKL